MTMDWSKLRTVDCPYCGAHLELGKDFLQCTSCLFTISEQRFVQIRAHRSGVNESKIKMKWQNILEDHCPVCGDMLTPDTKGQLDYMKCIDSACAFHISSARIKEIVEDKNHVAYRFYQMGNTRQAHNLNRI